MTRRIEYENVAPDVMRAMLALEQAVRTSGLEPALLHLVKLRASYMNGCAYCVDMHTKDARAGDESEQRLYAVPVWRETPFFTPRERAALAWTEALTRISHGEVSDELYAQARKHFSEKELVDLSLAIIAINGWNRLAVPFRSTPGVYQPPGTRKPA